MRSKSASDLSHLQPQEGLREGQARLRELAAEAVSNRLQFIAPTGYGKTKAAIHAYGELRRSRKVDRMLVIVPTDALREQWASKQEEFSSILGSCGKVFSLTKSERDIRYSRKSGEIFVVTYQALKDRSITIDYADEVSYWAALLSDHRWMVVLDEFHHLAEDQAWASLLRDSGLSSQFLLFMSATPFRSDKKATMGMDIDESSTVRVDIPSAIKEKAIRPIEGCYNYHYFVDVRIEGDVERLTTENLGKMSADDFQQFEVRQDIRYLDKYVSPILLDAIGQLDARNMEYPGQHQMIVFAMSVAHSEFVARTINQLAGREGFAKTVHYKQSKSAQKRLMREFDENKYQCLVQIDKAGEGFNNDRCSVVVFLHLLRAPTKLVQQIGRAMRRNARIPVENDRAIAYCPADSPVAAAVMGLEELEFGGVVKRDDDGPGADRVAPFLGIPEFQVVEVVHDRTEWLTDTDETESKERFVLKLHHALGLPLDDLRSSPESVLRALAQRVAGIERKGFESENERLKRLQEMVTKGVNNYARNAIIIRCNGSFERSLFGDTVRAIHTRWIKQSHGLNASKMTADDYSNKLEWVRDLNETMRDSREVPSWLRV